MARGISLTRDIQQRVFVPNRGDAFRLRVTAHDNELMPAEIFVYEQRVLDPYTAGTIDDFTHIASPIDLLLYPIGLPDPAQFPAFFRKAVVDFLVPGQTQAETAWQEIHDQVCLLVDALDALDMLVEVEVVRCGGDIEDSLSESESA